MTVKQHVCGVMLTMTTYGTWLRGDARGWVEDGRVFPPSAPLEVHDRALMAYSPYLFDSEQFHSIGEFIGRALIERLAQRILALTVQSWHVHLVVADSAVTVPEIVKCAKESVRYGLNPSRPIWTAKYDQRFCFDQRSLRTRIEYVERHNVEMGWSPRPWRFILGPDDSM